MRNTYWVPPREIVWHVASGGRQIEVATYGSAWSTWIDAIEYPEYMLCTDPRESEAQQQPRKAFTKLRKTVTSDKANAPLFGGQLFVLCFCTY